MHEPLQARHIHRCSRRRKIPQESTSHKEERFRKYSDRVIGALQLVEDRTVQIAGRRGKRLPLLPHRIDRRLQGRHQRRYALGELIDIELAGNGEHARPLSELARAHRELFGRELRRI